MTGKILLMTIGLATALLALGYALGGLWDWTAFVVAVGLLWLFSRWRSWAWAASVGLACFAGVAATGLLLELGMGWMLLGMVAALIAWDLDFFVRRMESAERVEQARGLEHQHLFRLLLVAGLGLLLAALSLGIRVQFGFTTAILLGLLAVLGLGQVIAFLRRQGH